MYTESVEPLAGFAGLVLVLRGRLYLVLRRWRHDRCCCCCTTDEVALQSSRRRAVRRPFPLLPLSFCVWPTQQQRRQEADVILFWMEQWPFWLLLVVSSLVKQLRNGRLQQQDRIE